MKLCITGGGTGGHLMVAQALAQSAVKAGHEVIFIGSTKGQDIAYFGGRGISSKSYFLKTTGIVDKKGILKLKAIWLIFKAFLEARRIIKEHKIDATYSVGGFSAAPASFATLSSFIPLYIHEQNAVSGKLNKLLKPFSRRFISAYDKKPYIKGYPVQDIFFKTARVRTKLETIIFLGGSHGAKVINDLALSVAIELKKQGIKIIHQAGELDYERVKKEYKSLDVDVELYAFTKELPSLILKSDLAVSRAGASTLWELTTNGLPALYIPYPYAAGDHQFYNAEFIIKNKMGWCVREDENLKENLMEIIKDKLDMKSLRLTGSNSKGVADKMIKDIELRLN